MDIREKETVIITGGCGFIFSYVTEYLVERGYNVKVIDNLSLGSHPEIINDSFTFIQKDVHDPSVVDTIREIDPHYIIHAAAYSDVDGSIKSSQDIVKANCDANLYVFEAAKELTNLKKLVYVSTDEVYGECEVLKSEEDIIFPKNPYSLSKAHGSLMRIAYDSTYSTLNDKTAETRFCNVVGERQDERKILPRIRQALETGDPVPVHNRGKGYREYIWVENIPPAIERVMLFGSRIYNITNNEGYTVNELIAVVEKLTGKKIPTTISERPGMDIKYQMEAERIYDLGWKPKTYFGEGLARYLFKHLEL